MRERLVELFKDFAFKCVEPCDKRIKQSENIIVVNCETCKKEQLADYLLANGVVVLPCKIGETLYDAREFFYKADAPDLYEMKSDDIRVEKDSKSGEYRFIYDDAYVSYDEIGKTVFLTKEEAEQALRKDEGEMKGKPRDMDYKFAIKVLQSAKVDTPSMHGNPKRYGYQNQTFYDIARNMANKDKD